MGKKRCALHFSQSGGFVDKASMLLKRLQKLAAGESLPRRLFVSAIPNREWR